jgi:hypothetical protein
MSEYELRGYGSKIGRWLSKDPLEELDDKGLYLFAHNNSVNHVDLLGLTIEITNYESECEASETPYIGQVTKIINKLFRKK